MARVDAHGRAYAGSQLQVQIYVNRRTEELNAALLEALPTLANLEPRISWASPLEAVGFLEFRDADFLQAVWIRDMHPLLRQFWPGGGPQWDALARLQLGSGERGVLLVEAKSHPGEILGPGCGAGEKPRRQIEQALADARHWLGAPAGRDWLGDLYQTANRLAHLYFFREIARVPAWMAFLYFVDDPYRPTSRKEWDPGLADTKERLGIGRHPYVADVFLPGRERAELLRP